jgi:hypothetical protein
MPTTVKKINGLPSPFRHGQIYVIRADTKIPLYFRKPGGTNRPIHNHKKTFYFLKSLQANIPVKAIAIPTAIYVSICQK